MEPKAQLRLVSDKTSGSTIIPVSHDSSITDSSPLQQHYETHEASDVLMTPRFVEDETDSESTEKGVQYHAIATSQLKAFHQALILAQCFLIENVAHNDELQSKHKYFLAAISDLHLFYIIFTLFQEYNYKSQ